MGAQLSKAQIVRVMSAAEERGRPIMAFRLCTNGDVILLTETPPNALPSVETDIDWVTLAGETEVSGA